MNTPVAQSLLVTLMLLAGTGLAAPPEGPARGSCSLPFPEPKGASDAANPGVFSCTEFYGEHVTLAMVKQACNGTVSANACPSGDVVLACAKPGKGGQVIARYYSAGNDPRRAAFNERLLKRGCQLPWTPVH